MARIRSIHPGLFTDEEFILLSDGAQIFLVGLLTECDDQGAFEWKPGTLRMRLRNNKDGSIEPLLDELVAVDKIMSYEHEGRKYGLVRNFRKWQRPKKPNSVHFIPEQFRTYTTSSAASSVFDDGEGDASSEPEPVKEPPVPQKREPEALEQPSIPKKSEPTPQREEGGDKMEEEDGGDSTPPPPADDLQKCFDAYNLMAKRAGLRRAQAFNKTRRSQLRKRLSECDGLDGFMVALSKVESSRFLRGGGRDGWKADFDFILQLKSFTKLMEGSYDDKSGANGEAKSSTFDSIRDYLGGRDGEGDPPPREPGDGDEIYPPDRSE